VSAQTRTRKTAAELKGRMLSVTRLRVLEPDLDGIGGQIDALALQIPQAVKGMAVIIESDVEVDLPALLQRLRQVGMQPLGVVDGALNAAAQACGLPVLSREAGRTSAPRDTPAAAAAPEPEPAPQAAVVPEPPAAPPAEAPAGRRPARIVSEPVRSGQQVYAQGSDLIVLNTVSPGAEVIADGCIHVYGKLSGRAIAGARGDQTARIFCRKLEAQLLAIAGIYMVAEQLKDAPRGLPAQIYFENGRLKIEPHSV
jgi:septum site-determining protein MinC